MAILLTAILCLIIGGGFAFLITYFYCSEQINQTIEYNQNIDQQNQELEIKNTELLQEQELLEHNVKRLQCDTAQYEISYEKLVAKHEEISRSIEIAEKSAEKGAKAIYDKTYEIMQDNLAAAAEAVGNTYRAAEEDSRAEYLAGMEECATNFNYMISNKQNEIAQLEAQLRQLASKVKAATAAHIRSSEENNRRIFYSINLSNADMDEIKRLKSVIYYFRNARPVYKAIWEAYFRNPTNEMVNRVVGQGTHCGIYKITNLLDEKIYIGQSNQIGERFKAHIKCGLGIDAPQNKLYTAMQKDGVENFCFEVMEECKPSELNEREKYWIDFYQSNIYGYNMSSGGAKANQ